ncbi:MAG: plasmid pRiA4b ORF-3 family protein [Candidatus Aegiribacteria sp.]|nr:plasmid pRiA4b ORF-3 family protein [Candidatus Aegiribacteria sp.]
MKNPPSKTQWKKLYNLANTVAELKPWKILSDYMVFGVRLSDYDINGYVGIAGKHGQSRGVFVYMGEPSMERVRFMGSPEIVMELSMLTLTFEKPETLPDKDRKIISSLKLNYHSVEDVPFFRSYSPGLHPWYLNKDDAAILIICLEQAVELLRRGKFEKLLDMRSEEKKCLYRIPGEDGKWTEIVEETPENPEFEKVFFIRKGSLDDLNELPDSNKSIQARLFPLPEPNGKKGERPSFAYMLILVDSETEFLLTDNILEIDSTIRDMELQVPEMLINELVVHGIKPKQLEIIKGCKLSEILRQLGYENFPVPVKEKKKLKALGNTLNILLNSLFYRDDLPDPGITRNAPAQSEHFHEVDDRIHVIKVALMYDKSVYRKIAIRSDQTLKDLHDAIFDAFDREEEHLYSFFFPDRPTKSKRAITDSPEYTLTGMTDEFFDEGQNDASEATIQSLKLRTKQKFYYIFDWGDEWWHELTYEGVKDIRKKDLPTVIVARGESPPQYPDYDEED